MERGFIKSYRESYQFSIFFSNLLRQIEAEVLDKKELRLILDVLSEHGGEFGEKVEILEAISGLGNPEFSDFEDLYHRAVLGPVDISNDLMIRIAPMGRIIEALIFPPEWDIQNDMLDDLDVISDSSKELFLRKTRESSFLNRFSSQKFEEFTGTWPEYLKLHDDRLIECSPDHQRSLGLGPISSLPPKFVSFLSPDTPSTCEIGAKLFDPASPMHEAADRLRDVLGLDGYSPSYGSSITLLGFVIFKASAIEDSLATRPTVFDETSDYRFYGSCDRNLTSDRSYGFTADLQKLSEDSDPSVIMDVSGARELVLNNPPFVEGEKVLVGYLGPVRAPRADVNEAVGSYSDLMSELHQRFLTKHLDGDDPAKILNELKRRVA